MFLICSSNNLACKSANKAILARASFSSSAANFLRSSANFFKASCCLCCASFIASLSTFFTAAAFAFSCFNASASLLALASLYPFVNASPIVAPSLLTASRCFLKLANASSTLAPNTPFTCCANI